MPAEGIDFSKREDLLSYEEIIKLGHIFRDLGITKVRITGGEPFVRKDMNHLLQSLSDIFPAVHITTNATLIHHHLDELKAIDIKGINISLDTLDPDKFNLITRRDTFDTVYNNILNCVNADLPVKINVVIMKGINDSEIPSFINLAEQLKIEVRFIEAMPFNQMDGNKSLFVPHHEILDIIKSSYDVIEPLPSDAPSASLKYLVNNEISVGVIPAYSRSLCSSCNRIRITPKGELLTCLYSEKGLNLRDLLRGNPTPTAELQKVIKNAVSAKLKSGWDEESRRDQSIFNSMTTIGG